MGVPVKVDLRLADDGRRTFLFHRDRAEADHDPPPAHPGLRGWFERKVHRFKDIWQHSDSGLVRGTRRVWDWLQRRVHPDEPMLIRMRTTPSLEIRHPTTMTAEEARAAWSEFLTGRIRRYLPWLVVNTLLAPVTVVLGPVPGPNVVFYWFAYRAARDLLALLGLRRARLERVPASFRPCEALDRPIRFTPPDDLPEGPEPMLSGAASHPDSSGGGSRLPLG
jgi:hypothetical protein